MLCLFQSALKELHELCLTSEIKVYAVSVSVYFKTFTRGGESGLAKPLVSPFHVAIVR